MFAHDREILPNALYDAQTLRLTLGVSVAAINRARRDGTLRHCRQGTRILYLGRWVLDWLDAQSVCGGARDG